MIFVQTLAQRFEGCAMVAIELGNALIEGQPMVGLELQVLLSESGAVLR